MASEKLHLHSWAVRATGMKGSLSFDASGALAQKKNHSVITHNAILITRVSESPPHFCSLALLS